MARLASTPVPGFDDYRAQTAAFEKLQKASDALPDDQIVGGVLHFQIADGYASYLVTKESPLTVQLIPYMDAYQVSDILIRGLRKQDVVEMLAREKRLRAMFAKKQAAA